MGAWIGSWYSLSQVWVQLTHTIGGICEHGVAGIMEILAHMKVE
jgi:hypothetical protein